MTIVGHMSILVVAWRVAIVCEEVGLLVNKVVVVEQIALLVVVLGSLFRALLLAA